MTSLALAIALLMPAQGHWPEYRGSMQGVFDSASLSSTYCKLSGCTMAGDINMNGFKLTLDADLNSYLYSPANDQIDFYIGGVNTLQLRSTIFTILTGASAPGSGSQSEQWGNSASATGTRSTALGLSAAASNTDTTAVGKSSTASASGSTAYGASASAAATDSTAIGKGASVASGVTGGIAIGNTAVIAASATQAVLIGYGTTLSGVNDANATVVGYAADSFGTGATAVGHGAGAGNAGVTIGQGAGNASQSAISIGNSAGSGGAANTIAIGESAAAAGQYSVALGDSSSGSTFTNCVALGHSATCAANNDFQVGASGTVLNIKSYGTMSSARTTDLGWTTASGANTACNTTCTSACVFGIDAATFPATSGLLACTDATADYCLCAGP